MKIKFLFRAKDFNIWRFFKWMINIAVNWVILFSRIYHFSGRCFRFYHFCKSLLLFFLFYRFSIDFMFVPIVVVKNSFSFSFVVFPITFVFVAVVVVFCSSFFRSPSCLSPLVRWSVPLPSGLPLLKLPSYLSTL